MRHASEEGQGIEKVKRTARLEVMKSSSLNLLEK